MPKKWKLIHLPIEATIISECNIRIGCAIKTSGVVYVDKKGERVGNFINTLKKDLIQVTHAAGYTHPCQFDTCDVVINVGDSYMRKTMEEIYGYKKTKVDQKKLML